MKLSQFDYTLPPELIAQRPAHPRDSARLLVLHRGAGRLEHRIFRDLPEYLDRRDVLVLNDTRVIPARLHGRKATGGVVEVLLLRPVASGAGQAERWEVLIRPSRRVRRGTELRFSPDLRGGGGGRRPDGVRAPALPPP